MPEEKDRRDAREAFRALSPRAKAEHIFTYYKWYILLAAAVLLIAAFEIGRFVTRREPAVYLALANVSVGADLDRALTEGYLASAGLDAKKYEVTVYHGLYISDTAEGEAHKSAYASRIKLMAAVESKTLDVLLMSGQAYDLMSGAGYLLELDGVLTGDAAERIVENEVVLEDNDLEYTLGEAPERVVTTEPRRNAAKLLISGFDEPVYAAITANTPRPEESARYIEYLLTLEAGE